MRPGRRRVRRQAGDADRGSRGVGRPQDRPPGEVGAHPAGAVHRHDDPPSDAGAGDGRRPPGRAAHRARPRRALRDRRLRQPCRRRAPSRLQRGAVGLCLPEQAGRRPRRLHEHRAAGPSAATASARRSSPWNPPSTRSPGASGSTPFALRRTNAVRPGDAMVAHSLEPHDVVFGSYGPRSVPQPRTGGDGGRSRPRSRTRLAGGTGMAMAMIDTIPPRGHYAQARVALAADGSYCVRVGTAEFGNGTSTVHRQIAAQVLGAAPDRVRISGADTDAVGHDTGAYGSTGTVVAVSQCCGRRKGSRGRSSRRPPRGGASSPPPAAWMARPCPHPAAVALADLAPLEAEGRSDGSPRSVAFNVQAFRVAVHPVSGEVRILRSVHAADAGTVVNPMQCRGQVEGRSGAGDRRGALRGGPPRRGGEGRDADPEELPHPRLRRRAGHAGALRRHLRQRRAAGRQIDERVALQPRRGGAGERDPRREPAPASRRRPSPRTGSIAPSRPQVRPDAVLRRIILQCNRFAARDPKYSQARYDGIDTPKITSATGSIDSNIQWRPVMLGEG